MDCQGLASEVPIAMIRQRTRDDFNEVILDCYFGQMNKRSEERHIIQSGLYTLPNVKELK